MGERDHPTAGVQGGRASPRPAAYHKLPIAEKRARAMGAMREPAVSCPVCETQTAARDLLEHQRARCAGRREPHAASEWVTFRAALAMGVLRGTLSKWVARGLVRVRGDVQDRRYLLRDVTTQIARRKFPRGNRPPVDPEGRP